MSTFSTIRRSTAASACVKPTNNLLVLTLFVAFVFVQFQFMAKNNELAIESAVQSAQLRCKQEEQQQEETMAAENQKERDEENNKCCVQCTSPQNQCCLLCSDTASPREHDLLMASMEGLTHHIMETFSIANQSAAIQQSHGFLKTRAWEGNSHIGNRPSQSTFYYDWIRSIQQVETVVQICEIGMNGGHSAVIFLAALHSSLKDSRIHLTMFDLSMFEYSKPVEKYINVLYPGMFTLHIGNSRETVPKWIDNNTKNGIKCDVFSVDGDHTYEGALIDIKNSAKATRKGGYIILDDMNPGGPTRKAFDEVVREGILEEPKCVEDVYTRVGYENRLDETNARELKLSWCTARIV